MQNFRFPLDRVLSWRQKQLEGEQARLVLLVAEQERLEATRLAILAAWEWAGRQMLAAGSMDGSDIAALGGYRARLEREREANERQQKDARERIVGQRMRVVEARRRVRLLEKLRLRKLDEWRVAWNREIENFAGEAFLARWGSSD